LAAVYRSLDLPFATPSVGAVRAEAPELSPDQLEVAITAGYRDRFDLMESALSDEAAALTRALVSTHRL
jgi:hypothetical protein